MKIIIDIPEHYIENNIKRELPITLSEDNIVAILPKVTNGDVIKALFPDSELHKESDYAYLTISKGVYLEDRDGTWWNEPYKAGDTE